MKNTSIQVDGVTFLSRQEVMEKFGICTATLWKWTSKGVIRHHRLGKRVYFIESEIREDILKNTSKGEAV
jgi:predicted DNA-binding transcriptional regulator AlpA